MVLRIYSLCEQYRNANNLSTRTYSANALLHNANINANMHLPMVLGITMETTKHAITRQQQRDIPNLMIELLQRFGRRCYDHRGGVIRYLDRRSRRAVEKYVGSQMFRRMHEFHDAYLVESAADGAIITCGHRYSPVLTH